ncbi:hypothetical protein BDV30DRAFT_223285 [Aspergillus minisclerotigenes]|uniref:Uncharacterized protein n=1 Tax=Aspergillus minisclerotigenes TaxID=656917 RepID=A0A5N6JHY8_9EURO|nr:hypothetical protein BDV30DRAFT_223285 [Aspergillus minisclerotigenes]
MMRDNGTTATESAPHFQKTERCRQASYDTWQSAATRNPECFFESYLNALLKLVRDVPPFRYSPDSDHVSGGYKCPLILRSRLLIETTRVSTCDQRRKSIDYFQCLGFPSPMAFETCTTPRHSSVSCQGLQINQAYLTTITLAWSYIISCRWVEICQGVGERAKLLHHEGLSFWELITQSLWSAEMARGKRAILSPWQLRERHHKWAEVSPDSALAFNILVDFCTSNHLEGEFLTGFATILMLTSRNVPVPKMEPPAPVSRPFTGPTRNDTKFRGIFEHIDKFMSLSVTQDALDALLCSAFFNPRVPCNLVGAVSLAVANKQPSLAFFWNAVVCSRQERPLLDMTFRDIPPVCLVGASWTNTIQSFLQATYYPKQIHEEQVKGGVVLRANDLEVKSHIGHDHRPLSWVLPSDSIIYSKEHETAEQQSLNATSRLFNWHRHYDDGLWLDDGKSDIGLIRRLQQHPWIVDPFDIDNEPNSPENSTCPFQDH